MTRTALIAATAALALLVGPAAAQAPATTVTTPTVATVGANLNISPKRVTFDPKRRSATVYIYNQGNAPATFDIAMIDRAMLPDGQIVAVADASQPDQKSVADKVKSAKDMVLMSPRRATLAPGQGQTIRLRLTNLPDTTEAAEYRSHLTITTVPPPSSGVTAEAAAGQANNELRFQITSVFGLSIPAIVRVGDPDVRAGIENPHIQYVDLSPDGVAPPRRTPVLELTLDRQGANSLFGNVEVRPAGKRGGDPIGAARGVGVYTEIDRRVLRIPLTRAPAAGEKLQITFTDDDTSPGKVLATATM